MVTFVQATYALVTGDICPYKQYLCCYWSNFDQTFWTTFFGVIIFVDQIDLDKFILDPKFVRPTIFFQTQNFFLTKIFLMFFSDQNFFGTHNFQKNIGPIKNFGFKKNLGPQLRGGGAKFGVIAL